MKEIKGTAHVTWYRDEDVPVHVEELDVKLTSSASLIFKSKKDGARVEYRSLSQDGVRLYGRRNMFSGYHLPFYISENACVEEDPGPITNRHWDQVPVRVVLPEPIRRVLKMYFNQLRNSMDIQNENSRRSAMRYEYIWESSSNLSAAKQVLHQFQFKTEEEACAQASKVFKLMRLHEELVHKSSFLWPNDLNLLCPGDAGDLGEFMLGISENNNNEDTESNE